MTGCLHLIEDDLAEHAWYVDLVADFVEVVERYLSYVALAEVDEG